MYHFLVSGLKSDYLTNKSESYTEIYYNRIPFQADIRMRFRSEMRSKHDTTQHIADTKYKSFLILNSSLDSTFIDKQDSIKLLYVFPKLQYICLCLIVFPVRFHHICPLLIGVEIRFAQLYHVNTA